MAATAVYYHPLFLEHDTGDHPESADRLLAVRRRLLASDLAVEWVESGAAPVEAITRVHAPEYVATVRRLAERGGGRLDWDTVVAPASYGAALHAAGAGIQAVEAACAEGRRSFLLVRPPGHHARPDQGMGFCLFNNIAVAAAHALAELDVERVFVFDWDVHHGNGTQEAFYDDPRVLFCGFHMAHHYPGTGAVDETGVGAGTGYTANLPLPHGAGDGAVLAFFTRVVLPLLAAFEPQLVLVSAGYDSLRGDPLGGLALSEDMMRWMAASLKAACDRSGAAGPVCFLEGGYDLGLLADGVVATIAGLGDSVPGEAPAAASAREDRTVDTLVAALAPRWGGVLA
jgi:acetoin utilization deacetylase AcuC-like enzyme